MSTTFEGPSPVGSSTSMASASTVSKTFVNSTFHNHHVILASPSRVEEVNLTLSPSSSFLANYAAVSSSNPPKSSIPANFAISLVNSSSEKVKPMCLPSHNTVSHLVEQPTNDWQGQDNSAKLQQNGVSQEQYTHLQASIESRVFPGQASTSDDVIILEDEVKKVREGNTPLPDIDENSSTSSSTQSSENTQSSGRRKRRRGEEQILMEDLIGIDKSLAADIATHLKSPIKSMVDACNNSLDSNDLSSKQFTDGEPKKSKDDSPAFRLRPRRSAKSTSFSGYCSGSGSSSPISIMYSPVKRSKQPVLKKSINTYTQQLLSDTSKQLSQFLNNQQNGVSGHNETNSKENSDTQGTCKPFIRSFSKSIVQDVNVSVFAELITPLEITFDFSYPDRYLSLTICDIKPLRHVYLLHPQTKDKVSSPLLELTTIDINDRFLLKHTKGIFDDSTSSQAPNKQLTVYLLGTYALKANEIAAKGQVVNIVKFRSTKSTQIDNALTVQPPKKRKLTLNPKTPSEQFPFGIIVDALPDITAVGEDRKLSSLAKKELSDIDEEKQEMHDDSAFVEITDHFEEMFQSSPYSELASKSNWVPLVSFSSSWRAPDDPSILNRSLHVIQPSIPKFESASRTVKMNP